MQLRTYAAPGVEAMAVGPVVSGSVVELIIDPSIPAGAECVWGGGGFDQGEKWWNRGKQGKAP